MSVAGNPFKISEAAKMKWWQRAIFYVWWWWKKRGIEDGSVRRPEQSEGRGGKA